MSIAVDFDGVIVDTSKLKSEGLARRGFERAPADTDRDAVLAFGVPLAVYEEAAFTANVIRLREAPLVAGVREALSTLVSRGHQIVLVTSRKDHEVESVRSFVKAHSLPVQEVLHTRRAHKAQTLIESGAEVIVEDTVSKLENLPSSIRKIWLRQPWNAYQKPREDLEVAESWSEIVEMLTS